MKKSVEDDTLILQPWPFLLPYDFVPGCKLEIGLENKNGKILKHWFQLRYQLYVVKGSCLHSWMTSQSSLIIGVGCYQISLIIQPVIMTEHSVPVLDARYGMISHQNNLYLHVY